MTFGKYPQSDSPNSSRDGGLLTADRVIAWGDPNNWEVSGTLSITLPTPEAAFNGATQTFKNTGTGTITVIGEIDGVSNYVSSTQNEAIELKVVNSKWALV